MTTSYAQTNTVVLSNPHCLHMYFDEEVEAAGHMTAEQNSAQRSSVEMNHRSSGYNAAFVTDHCDRTQPQTHQSCTCIDWAH